MLQEPNSFYFIKNKPDLEILRDKINTLVFQNPNIISNKLSDILRLFESAKRLHCIQIVQPKNSIKS
jgi:Ran GTPase-activating protein (RanGAP) involved in mRNA processing and transport